MKGLQKTGAGTFRAMFYHRRKQYYLGTFATDSAAAAALAAEARLASSGAYPPPIIEGPKTAFETFSQWFDYAPDTGQLRYSRLPKGSLPGVAGTLTDRGYVAVSLFDHRYLAHRVAWLLMTGEWPQCGVDHINGDRSDNRWLNLRLATPRQNQWNRAANANSSSPFKGVHYDPRGKGRWRAKITVDGKGVCLGGFETPEAARDAYLEAAQKHFGEFARAD